MLLAACRLVLGAGLALGCVVGCSTAAAHPPELHRARMALRGEVEREPTEADRQAAWFALEFFTTFVGRVGSPLADQVVAQSIDEHRFATKSPGARGLAELEKRRGELMVGLRAQHGALRVTWDGARLAAEEPLPPLDRARGMNRHLIVELTHTAVAPARLAVGVSGHVIQAEPWTVLPGRTQPFLVVLSGDADARVGARLEVKEEGAVAVATLPLPFRVVEPVHVLIRVVDGETGQPVAARVRAIGGDGTCRHAGPFAGDPTFTAKPILGLPLPRFSRLPFFYCDASTEIALPPGECRIEVERGFEHSIVTDVRSLEPGESRAVTLTVPRIIDAAAEGWISGDTHVHWVTNAWNVDLPLEALGVVQRAEDLRVVNNLTLLHRTASDAFVKPSQAPVGPVAGLCQNGYHVEMAEEYRNENLYGHLCFLNLRWLVMPIGTGPGIAGDDSIDWPHNRPAIEEARSQGGISIEAHGTGGNHESPLNVIHGLTDSFDQLGPADFERFLDCGFRIPLTNGSDHPARVVGAARAYVRIDGDFSYEKWIDGIRRGRTFTTSGPLLFLDVDGHTPGDSIARDPDDRVTVRVRAVSREPLGVVQVVSNGVVIAEETTEETTAELAVDLSVGESRWIVARASRGGGFNCIERAGIAHTSAVQVVVEGRGVFRPEAARDWIVRMRAHIRDIELKGRFATAGQRNEAVAYVEEGIGRYERLIARRAALAASTVDETRDHLLLTLDQLLPRPDARALEPLLAAAESSDSLAAAVEPLVVLRVDVNPESRVKLAAVSPLPELVVDRTYRCLLEVQNAARIRAPLRIAATDRSVNLPRPALFCAVGLIDGIASSSFLSGAEREWKIIEIRLLEEGRREVHLEADVGQGTQDLGFRAAADLLLKGVPARRLSGSEKSGVR
ncbi:MAG: hypothetical protein EXS06_09195 [Planctomycetaceae bacterium]|nr:hypothetical protein [Planctomycetaceae bacterium]